MTDSVLDIPERKGKFNLKQVDMLPHGEIEKKPCGNEFKSGFNLSVESNSDLLRFCNRKLSDWFKKTCATFS